MLLFAGAPTLAIAFPLAVLVGATSMTFMTSATAIVQLRAEPQMRGRVLALQSMVFLGSTPIGGPILGAVCDEWGPRAGVLVGAVAAFAAAAWGAVAIRRGLRSTRAQSPRSARRARMPSFELRTRHHPVDEPHPERFRGRRPGAPRTAAPTRRRVRRR